MLYTNPPPPPPPPLPQQAVYGLANKLFSRARELVASGEGQKEPLEREARTLEDVVGAFASRLDERREVILDAGKYYQLKDAVSGYL